MRAIIEFGFDLVSRIACPPIFLHSWILGQRISALNHEPFHDAMKSGSVVKAFLCEGLEILDRFWRYIRPEFQDQLARGRFDDRDFIRLRAHSTSKEKQITSPSPLVRS